MLTGIAVGNPARCWKAWGKVDCYIPTGLRGYGLNQEAIEQLAERGFGL